MKSEMGPREITALLQTGTQAADIRMTDLKMVSDKCQ